MSVGETIANLFSGVNTKPPAPAPASAPAASQVHPPATSIPATAGTTAPATATTAPNGVLPPDTATPATPAPLDEYSKLWDTDPNAAPVDTSVFGNIDGNALLASAAKIDFTKVVTPELLTSIQAGGEEGTRALMQALNSVAQQTHAQSSFSATKIAELAVEKAREQFTAQIPDIIKAHNTNNLVRENPVLSHPAAQPIVAGLVSQLQAKFPNATPAELNKQAEDYFSKFASSFIKQSAPAPAAPTTQDTDWQEFFK